MNIGHSADVWGFGQVSVLSDLTGFLTFMASTINVPIANAGLEAEISTAASWIVQFLFNKLEVTSWMKLFVQ